MRTEFKIGIVVGLVVIAGAIIFFVNQGRKASGTTDVVPMSAPAHTIGPAAAGKEKPGEKKPLTPARGLPAVGEQRPIVTPPPGPKPVPTTQPAVVRPSGAGTPPRAGETTAAPAVSPPRTVPAASKPVAERAPTSQPRPVPELPPLVSKPEPATETTEAPSPAPERPMPVVTAPPRKEPEPVGIPAAQPRGTPAAAVRKYTVAEGESLWSIAEEQYGDGRLWTKLLAANPGIPENVQVGQVLNLPPKEELLAPTPLAAKPASGATETKAGAAKPQAEARETKPAARGGTYVVVKNDTLYSIAAKVLGNGHRWREIYELNKDKLERPEDLQVGMELKLPAKEGEAGKKEPAKPAGQGTGAREQGKGQKAR
jgi:nucleoid-associated protein YgaU